MKGIFWLWVVFLLVILVTDTSSYWVTRYRLSQSLELALDGALVGSVAEEDLVWGKNQAREDRANALAWDIMRSNMAGAHADSLQLQLKLLQENDRVHANGQASVKIPYLLGGVVGRGSREIAVNKRLSYQGLYK